MAQANPPPPYGFSADNNQAQMPMPSAPEDNAKSVNASKIQTIINNAIIFEVKFSFVFK